MLISKSQKADHLSFDALLEKSVKSLPDGSSEDLESFRGLWISIFNFVQEKSKDCLKVQFEKVFTVYRPEGASQFSLELLPSFLSANQIQQFFDRKPAFQNTILLNLAALQPKATPRQKDLFLAFMNTLVEILVFDETTVEFDLRYYGKVFKRGTEIVFVAPKNAPTTLFAQRDPNHAILLKSLENRLIQDRNQEEEKTKKDTGLVKAISQNTSLFIAEAPSSTTTVSATKEKIESRFKLGTKLKKSVNPISTRMAKLRNEPKEGELRLDVNLLKRDQHFSQTLKPGQLFTEQQVEPPLSKHSLPPLIDSYSQTLCCPISTTDAGLSVSARIGSYYSPLGKHLLLDPYSKRLKVIKLPQEEKNSSNQTFSLAEQLLKEKYFHNINPEYLSNTGSAEVQAEMSLHIYNDLIDKVLKDDDVLELAQDKAIEAVNSLGIGKEIRSEKVSKLLEDLLAEVASEFRLSLKKSVLDYILKDPSQRHRLSISHPPPTEPEYGARKAPATVLPSVFTLFSRAETLASKLCLFSKFSQQVAACYEELSTKSLFNLDLPDGLQAYTITEFIEKQRSHSSEICGKIKSVWIKRASDIYRKAVEKLSLKKKKAFCDTMVHVLNGQLRDLILRSIQELNNFFRKFLDETTPGKKNYFLVFNLVEREKSTSFEFTHEVIDEKLRGLITDAVNSSMSVPRPEAQIFQDKLTLKSVSNDEDIIVTADATIAEAVTLITSNALSVKKQLSQFDYLFYEIETLGTSLSDPNIDKETLKQMIVKYKNLEREVFESLPIDVYTQLAYINTSEIKTKWFEIINTCRLNILEKASSEINGLYSKVTKNLKSASDGIVPLSEAVDKLVEAEAKIEKFFKNENPKIKAEYAELLDWVLEFLGYPEVVTEEKLREIQSSKKKYLEAQEAFEKKRIRVSEERSDIEKKLGLQRISARESAERLLKDLEKIKEFKRSFHADKALSELEKLKTQLKKLNSDLLQINKDEEALGFSKCSIPTLNEAEKLISLYESFWLTFKTWTTEKNANEHASIFLINAVEFEQNIEKWLVTCEKVLTEFKPEPTLKELVELCEETQREMQDFQRDLGVVKWLTVKGLKPRHWDAINSYLRENKVETRLDPTREAGIKFSFLRQINLKAHKKRLAEISESAAVEWIAEQKLSAIESEWADKQIVGDSPAFEELLSLLEDHLITLQTLAETSLSSALKPKIDAQAGLLAKLSLILRLWEQVHHAYNDSESLFTSPDFVSSMVTESAKFRELTADYQKFVKERSENPSALYLAEQPNSMRRLEEILESIERLQKALETHFSKKRAYYPRFNFLSNERLAQVAVAAKDPPMLVPLLRTLFSGVDSVRFSDLHEVEAVLSLHGEKLDLSQKVLPFKLKDHFEVWFRNFEDILISEIKVSFIRALDEFSVNDMKKTDFIINKIQQIGYLIMQVDITMMIESAFETSPSVTLADCLQEIQENIQAFSSLLKRGNILLERKFLSALFLCFAKRDLINKLMESKVDSNQHFLFQYAMNHYLDEENNHELFIKLGEKKMEYGFEYLGTGRRLIHDPMTEQNILHLASAMGSPMNAAQPFCIGLAGNSIKNSTVKELACILGKDYVHAHMKEFRQERRVFIGACSSGLWVLLDFAQIPEELLVTFARHFQLLQQFASERKAEILIDGVSAKLRRSAGFFLQMKNDASIPPLLTQNLRHVYLAAPDSSKIAVMLLESFGFIKAAQLAGPLRRAIPDPMKMVKAVFLSHQLREVSQELEETILYRAVLKTLYGANGPKEQQQAKDLLAGFIAARGAQVKQQVSFNAEASVSSGLLGEYTVRKIEEEEGREESLLIRIAEELNFVPEPETIDRALKVRFALSQNQAVILFGREMSGKSVTLKILQKAAGVKATVVPLALGPRLLFGDVGRGGDWREGVVTSWVNGLRDSTNPWIVFEGPLDGLSDAFVPLFSSDRKLIKSNGDVHFMPPNTSLIIETDSLARATPGLLSKAFLVNFDDDSLTWFALFERFLSRFPPLGPSESASVSVFLHAVLAPLFAFAQGQRNLLGPFRDNVVAYRILKITKALFRPFELGPTTKVTSEKELRVALINALLFATVWAVGSLFPENSRRLFDSNVKKMLTNCDKSVPAEVAKLFARVAFPEKDLLFDHRLSLTCGLENGRRSFASEWVAWPVENSGVLLPRHGVVLALSELMLNARRSVLVVGADASGKSRLMKEIAKSKNALVLNSVRTHVHGSFAAYFERCTRQKSAPVVVVDDLALPTNTNTLALLLTFHGHRVMPSPFRQDQVIKLRRFALVASSSATQFAVESTRFSRFIVLQVAVGEEATQTIFETSLGSNSELISHPRFQAKVPGLISAVLRETRLFFLKRHEPFPAQALLRVGKIVASESQTPEEAGLLLLNEAQRIFADRLPSNSARRDFVESALRPAVEAAWPELRTAAQLDQPSFFIDETWLPKYRDSVESGYRRVDFEYFVERTKADVGSVGGARDFLKLLRALKFERSAVLGAAQTRGGWAGLLRQATTALGFKLVEVGSSEGFAKDLLAAISALISSDSTIVFRFDIGRQFDPMTFAETELLLRDDVDVEALVGRAHVTAEMRRLGPALFATLRKRLKLVFELPQGEDYRRKLLERYPTLARESCIIASRETSEEGLDSDAANWGNLAGVVLKVHQTCIEHLRTSASSSDSLPDEKALFADLTKLYEELRTQRMEAKKGLQRLAESVENVRKVEASLAAQAAELAAYIEEPEKPQGSHEEIELREAEEESLRELIQAEEEAKELAVRSRTLKEDLRIDAEALAALPPTRELLASLSTSAIAALAETNALDANSIRAMTQVLRLFGKPADSAADVARALASLDPAELGRSPPTPEAIAIFVAGDAEAVDTTQLQGAASGLFDLARATALTTRAAIHRTELDALAPRVTASRAQVDTLTRKVGIRSRDADQLRMTRELAQARRAKADRDAATLAAKTSRWQKVMDTLHVELEASERRLAPLFVKDDEFNLATLAAAADAAYGAGLTQPGRQALRARVAAVVDRVEGLRALMGVLEEEAEWTASGLPSDPQLFENALLLRVTRSPLLLLDETNGFSAWLKGFLDNQGRLRETPAFGLESGAKFVCVKQRAHWDLLKKVEAGAKEGHVVLVEEVEFPLEPALEAAILAISCAQPAGPGQTPVGVAGPVHSDFRLLLATLRPAPAMLPPGLRAVNCTASADPRIESLRSLLVEKDKPDLWVKAVDLRARAAALARESAAHDAALLASVPSPAVELLDSDVKLKPLRDLRAKAATFIEKREKFAAAEAEVATAVAAYDELAESLVWIFGGLRKLTGGAEPSLGLDGFFRAVEAGLTIQIPASAEDRRLALRRNLASQLVARAGLAESPIIRSRVALIVVAGLLEPQIDRARKVAEIAFFPDPQPTDLPNLAWPADLSPEIRATLDALAAASPAVTPMVIEAELAEPGSSARSGLSSLELAVVRGLLHPAERRSLAEAYAVGQGVSINSGGIERALTFGSKTLPLFVVEPELLDYARDLRRVARSRNIELHLLSVDRGAGPALFRALEDAAKSGEWLLLVGAAKSVGFLRELHHKLLDLKAAPKEVDNSFRLFVAIQSVSDLPAGLRAAGVVTRIERPRGFRELLAHALETAFETFRSLDRITAEGPVAARAVEAAVLFALLAARARPSAAGLVGAAKVTSAHFALVARELLRLAARGVTLDSPETVISVFESLGTPALFAEQIDRQLYSALSQRLLLDQPPVLQLDGQEAELLTSRSSDLLAKIEMACLSVFFNLDGTSNSCLDDSDDLAPPAPAMLSLAAASSAITALPPPFVSGEIDDRRPLAAAEQRGLNAAVETLRARLRDLETTAGLESFVVLTPDACASIVPPHLRRLNRGFEEDLSLYISQLSKKREYIASSLCRQALLADLGRVLDPSAFLTFAAEQAGGGRPVVFELREEVAEVEGARRRMSAAGTGLGLIGLRLFGARLTPNSGELILRPQGAPYKGPRVMARAKVIDIDDPTSFPLSVLRAGTKIGQILVSTAEPHWTLLTSRAVLEIEELGTI